MLHPAITKNPEAAPIEMVLRVDGRGLILNFNEIWRYRDLFLILIWRDFSAKYKQTILGPLWLILQPVLMTMIFTVLFAHVAGLSTDGLPPLLFYLSGQLGWTYFSTNFSANSAIFVNNAGLFSKVYFPRLVVPLSSVVSNLCGFVLQAATFLVFFVYFKCTLKTASFGMDWRVLFLPLLVFQTAALSLGAGLVSSAFTAKYRDLMHVLNVLIQLWMYATPVILPLSKYPEKWRWIVALNPMTMVIEAYRLTLLGTGTVLPQYVFSSAVLTVLALSGGVVLFNKVEKTAMDSV